MKEQENQIVEFIDNAPAYPEAHSWDQERSDEDLDNFLERRLGALGLGSAEFTL